MTATAPKGLHWIEMGQWPPQMAITADKRAYNRWMKAQQGASHQPFPGGGAGHTELMTNEHNHEGIVMLAVHLTDDSAENICTLAHEAVHAARFLFVYVGEDTPGKETEAYLVEHIVRHGMRALGISPK